MGARAGKRLRAGRRVGLTSVVMCMAGLATSAAVAQAPDDAWTVSQEEIDFARSAPLFASDEILELSLSADFHTLKIDPILTPLDLRHPPCSQRSH